MISSLLHQLEAGLRALQNNARLLFVVVLLFVFPLLFVFLLQSFFTIAKTNIESVEMNSLSQLHDTIAFVAVSNESDLLQPLFETIAEENPAITKLRVLARTADGFQVLFAQDESVVGTFEQQDELLRTLPLAANSQSVIFKTTIDGARTWQAFRKISAAGTDFIIFSEHSFAATDAVLISRQQQAYMSLSGIFLFLLALAYWIQKQTNWAYKHAILTKQLAERDAFTHMIAHEFRTPLTAIKGYASFLEDSKAIASDDRQYATNISLSAQRLVVLVNDFLEVARIQAGKLNLKPQLLDVGAVVVEVCEQLQPIAKEHNLHLVYHKQQGAIKFYVDKYRLVQVLINLITNSIKYTESGSVEVEVNQYPHKLVIKIKDSGKGMSTEDQRQIFTQFTRVGTADKSTIVGSGLGMWITKQLVEMLGGTIGVESIEGVGTHVVLTFPH